MTGATLQEASAVRETGLLGALRAAPRAAALLVLLGLTLAVLGSAALTGNLGLMVDPGAVFHTSIMARANFVIAVVLAFALWAELTTRTAVATDLQALRDGLDPADSGLDALLARWWSHGRSGAVALLLGALAGGLIVVTSHYRFAGGWHWSWNFLDTCNVPLTLGLFALLGKLGHSSVLASRLLSELGRRHTRVQLLEREPLRPFARCGLRLGRNWFVGSAIAMLLLFDLRATAVVAAVIAATVALGLASLVLPSLGIHERLREAKRSELARVRAAIELRSAALFDADPPPRPEVEPALPSLLAYEARLQQVSEWPFDVPTLLRFAVLVLIPLGSWVAGAMVERLVDAALG